LVVRCTQVHTQAFVPFRRPIVRPIDDVTQTHEAGLLLARADVSHVSHPITTNSPCLHAFLVAQPLVRQTVVIVDTSNEIGGDGDIPLFKAIGLSRRMMVPDKDGQHR